MAGEPITLADVMAAFTGRLDDAGVRWTVDAQKLDPPCVLVPIPTMTFRFNRASVDAGFAVVAVAQVTDRDTAIAALSDLIEQVQSATGGAITDASPADVTTADQSASLLSAELRLSLSLSTQP
jgi:hypothetical protein